MVRKIVDIYDEYKIRYDIKDHMLKVAAVASLICNSLDEELDKENIILTCLLHDMGNIIKVDFVQYPEFSEPYGEEYWRGVKNEFLKKYGKNEDQATMLIAKELNLSEKFLNLLKNVVVTKLEDNSPEEDIRSKICKYADTRVSPKKVLSVRDRLEEWQKRNTKISKEYMENTYKLFTEIEKEIFSKCKIKPEDITDEAIESIVLSLKDFMIE
jgi:5'-deoxynucleotidase YfbR-like HD superfamily hydrolase